MIYIYCALLLAGQLPLQLRIKASQKILSEKIIEIFPHRHNEHPAVLGTSPPTQPCPCSEMSPLKHCASTAGTQIWPRRGPIPPPAWPPAPSCHCHGGTEASTKGDDPSHQVAHEEHRIHGLPHPNFFPQMALGAPTGCVKGAQGAPSGHVPLHSGDARDCVGTEGRAGRPVAGWRRR